MTKFGLNANFVFIMKLLYKKMTKLKSAARGFVFFK